VFTFRDGSTYEGLWQKGRKHGIGVFRPPAGAGRPRGAALQATQGQAAGAIAAGRLRRRPSWSGVGRPGTPCARQRGSACAFRSAPRRCPRPVRHRARPALQGRMRGQQAQPWRPPRPRGAPPPRSTRPPLLQSRPGPARAAAPPPRRPASPRATSRASAAARPSRRPLTAPRWRPRRRPARRCLCLRRTPGRRRRPPRPCSSRSTTAASWCAACCRKRCACACACTCPCCRCRHAARPETPAQPAPPKHQARHAPQMRESVLKRDEMDSIFGGLYARCGACCRRRPAWDIAARRCLAPRAPPLLSTSTRRWPGCAPDARVH
jgi:hypothetical protein